MKNRFLIAITALFLSATLAWAGGRGERADDGAPEASEPVEQQRPEDTQPGTRIGVTESDDAVATVNGVGISREKFEAAVSQTRQSFQMQGQMIGEADLEDFRTEILNQMIAEELIYQEAVNQGLEVSDETVESQFQQIRRQFDTDEAWEQALEANDTSEAELREQIRRNDLIQQLISTAVSETGQVTDADIQDFYDDNPEYFDQGQQVAARHIIILTQGMSEEEISEARERIESIREELLAGGDFAELAREHSEDGSASQGGDLGMFGRGQMVPEFEQAAFTLDEGEISDVVETQFGFHIIQVTERVDDGMMPIEDVSQSIQLYLGQVRQAEALEEYVDRLREAAEIVIHS
jgi:parvulin-like peptidyl-prolyl isomerase